MPPRLLTFRSQTDRDRPPVAGRVCPAGPCAMTQPSAPPAPTHAPGTQLVFGRWSLQPAERTLRCDGQPVSLGGRAFDLLVTLADRRDIVIGKGELMDRVWPDLHVEENNLAVQISTLRKLLGAHAIATVPGRGYRLTLLAIGSDGRSGGPATAGSGRRSRRLPAASAETHRADRARTGPAGPAGLCRDLPTGHAAWGGGHRQVEPGAGRGPCAPRAASGCGGVDRAGAGPRGGRHRRCAVRVAEAGRSRQRGPVAGRS